MAFLPLRWATAVLVAGTACLSQDLGAAAQRVLTPRLDQTAVVEEAQFSLFGFQFVLHSGALARSAANGAAMAFQGRGELHVRPSNAIEAVQLRHFAGAEPLSLIFDRAVFRFAEPEALQKAMGAEVHWTPASVPPALTDILRDDATLITATGRPEAARILDAWSGPPESALATNLLFVAVRDLNGRWLNLENDPLQAESARVHAYTVPTMRNDMMAAAHRNLTQGPSPQYLTRIGFDDIWTQFQPADEPAVASPWKIETYQIERSGILGAGVQVQTRLTLRQQSSPHGGLFLMLDGNYRLQRAALDDGKVIPCLQAIPAEKASLIELYDGDWLYCQLPAATSAVTLTTTDDHARVTVLGKPKTSSPGGVVVNNVAWYPLPAFGPALQWSAFALLFSHSPQPLPQIPPPDERFQVPAVGAIPPDADTSVRYVQLASKRVTLQLKNDATFRDENGPTADEIASALRFYSDRLGDYPFGNLDLTFDGEGPELGDPLSGRTRSQIQRTAALSNIGSRWFTPGRYLSLPLVWRDLPSWPGQIEFNPATLGIGHSGNYNTNTVRQAAEVMLPHELAHQWFGDIVGWSTYRDQWLNEGLCNALAVLFDESAFGRDHALATKQLWITELVARDESKRAPNDAGPLSLGIRLDSSQDPAAFPVVIYDKGGFVITMLREMMRQTGAQNPDARFYEMLRAYLSEYKGKSPDTADFEAIAEKYMTPAMDLDGDHHLRWFFANYVEGTLIPRLRATIRTEPAGAGAAVHVRVDNPDGWHGLLPIYSFNAKGAFERGWMPIQGASSTADFSLPFPPTRTEANAFDDMLVQMLPPSK